MEGPPGAVWRVPEGPVGEARQGDRDRKWPEIGQRAEGRCRRGERHGCCRRRRRGCGQYLPRARAVQPQGRRAHVPPGRKERGQRGQSRAARQAELGRGQGPAGVRGAGGWPGKLLQRGAERAGQARGPQDPRTAPAAPGEHAVGSPLAARGCRRATQTAARHSPGETPDTGVPRGGAGGRLAVAPRGRDLAVGGRTIPPLPPSSPALLAPAPSCSWNTPPSMCPSARRGLLVLQQAAPWGEHRHLRRP